MKRDIYTQVTDQIIAELERGVLPWRKPWSAGHPAGPVSRPLRHNAQPYSGINVIMLWMAAMARGFDAPLWMTFKQAKDLGGFVRKGEKGAPVVYAGTLTREEETAGGDLETREIPFLKTYTVFNVAQIDGLPGHFTACHPPQINESARIARAEAFVAATGAEIEHGGNRAFYAPGPDRVSMPDFASFRNPEAYYGTLGHELIHWTGHAARLDRQPGTDRFGSEAYAMEELVAEIGAAFLCADLALTPQIREDHAPYIAGWLTVLKNDKRAVFTAAAAAQKAADYLHGLQAPLETGRAPALAAE
jgi:antirestriction protein ArdC